MTTEIEDSIARPSSEELASLVMKGFTREAAVELLDHMGPPKAEESFDAWAERVTGSTPAKERRKQILKEHHAQGLPPPEPPPLID